MEEVKARLKCSLSWAASMLQGDGKSPQASMTELSLLEDPFCEQLELKQELVEMVSKPAIYSALYRQVCAGEHLVSDGSFWPIIHGLARRGFYLQEGGVPVNHTLLAARSPLIEGAHQLLLASLMVLHAGNLAGTGRVVRAVRRISGLNASKELPASTEEALLLWVNKTCQICCWQQQKAMQEMLREPLPTHRKLNRLNLLRESMTLLKARQLCEVVSDGQYLAAVLLHYSPRTLSWAEFHFSCSPLPEHKALHNLRKVVSYATTHLPPPYIHLLAEELQHWGHSTLFRENTLVMLAQLFHQLEVRASPFPALPLPTIGEERRQGLPLLPSLRRSMCSFPLSSVSLTNLPSQPVMLCHRVTPAGGVVPLQSFSTPTISDSIVKGSISLEQQTHTILPGVIRNPGDSRQSKVLSSFQRVLARPGWEEMATPTPGGQVLSSADSQSLSLELQSSLMHMVPVEVSTLGSTEAHVGATATTGSDADVSSVSTSETRRPFQIRFVKQPRLSGETLTCDEPLTRRASQPLSSENCPSSLDTGPHHFPPNDQPISEDAPAMILAGPPQEEMETKGDTLSCADGHVVSRASPFQEDSDNNGASLERLQAFPRETGSQSDFTSEEGLNAETLVLRASLCSREKRNEAQLAVHERYWEEKRGEPLKRVFLMVHGHREEVIVPAKPIQPVPSIVSVPQCSEPCLPAGAKQSNPHQLTELNEPLGSGDAHSKSEDLRKRRQQEMRARLEKREMARQTALEQRRLQAQQNRKPRSREHLLSDAVRGTVQYKLSMQASSSPPPSMAPQMTGAAPLLSTKTNRQLIRNALSFVCLAGEANIISRQKALMVLDSSNASHFLILFRNSLGCKFKGVYVLASDCEHIFKVYGAGPKVIHPPMINKLLKYNSGSKEFRVIPSTTLSISVDALTIQDHYWTNRKTRGISGAPSSTWQLLD